MEKFSLKNILWIIFGIASGYYIGQIFGAILGSLVWTFTGVLSGGLVYYSTMTIVVNTVVSICFGVLLSLLVGTLDRILFGSKMSPAIWIAIGAALGVIVMFSYGINFITHPERYVAYQRYFPDFRGVELRDISERSPSYEYRLQAVYGTVTGQWIGLYLGLFTGGLISIRETIGKKQKPEDKKEFEEYSKFFKDRLKK